MKPIIKTSVLFVIALAFYNLSAKEVFPTQDVVWRNISQSDDLCHPYHYYSNRDDNFTLEGSFILDSIEYSKLFYIEKDSSFASAKDPRYLGGLRVKGDQVWFYPDPWFTEDLIQAKEFILYDFSLQKGDSFVYTGPKLHILDYIISQWEGTVDSVYYDDQDRKHLIFKTKTNFKYPTDEWIEGVGSLNGFLSSFGEIAIPVRAAQGEFYATKLACCKVKENVLYKECSFCFRTKADPQSLSTIEMLFSIVIKDSQMTVSGDNNPTTALLDLFDPTGKVIFSQIISEQQTTFNLSHLPKGVLMYQITPLEGKRETGKVMNR